MVVIRSNNPTPVAIRSFITVVPPRWFPRFMTASIRGSWRDRKSVSQRPPIPLVLRSLSYESLTEHQAFHAACHAEGAVHITNARGNGLDSVARIGNQEPESAGVRLSCACAIEERPDAGPSMIALKANGARPGRRIERGGAN